MEDPAGHAGDTSCEVSVGDEVWVKPPFVKCTSQWGKGVITDVNSSNNVSVDGMPRHILDIRRVVESDEEEDGVVADQQEQELSVHAADGQEVEAEAAEDRGSRYPSRIRRPPERLKDFEW